MTNEQVPVIGGPLDGQTHRLRLTASKWIVPDSADMIHGIKDGEPYTLFGQHIYELKCYVKDGEKWYQWEHVGYQKPEVQLANKHRGAKIAAYLTSETAQLTNGDDITLRLARWCEQPDDSTATQALMDEAAREIERLRLTDAERGAIDIAESWLPPQCGESAATLRKLLERNDHDAVSVAPQPTAGDRSGNPTSHSGTGNTQEPVAWAVENASVATGLAWLIKREAVDFSFQHGGRIVPLYSSPTLTDEERAALHWFAHYGLPEHRAATLRKLLERLR